MPSGVYIRTQETRKKMSLSRIGIKLSNETKSRISNSNKGKIMSEEAKKKISKTLMNHVVSDTTKKKISERFKGVKHSIGCRHCKMMESSVPWNKNTKWNKNKYPNMGHHIPHSEETKLKFKLFRIKEKTSAWKGGISIGKNEKKYMRRKCLERHARKLNADGSHTWQEWEGLVKRYNHICLCCKKQEPFVKLTEDHIIPLTKGGSDYINNIQPLCHSCNARKGNRHTTDYRNLIKIDI